MLCSPVREMVFGFFELDSSFKNACARSKSGFVKSKSGFAGSLYHLPGHGRSQAIFARALEFCYDFGGVFSFCGWQIRWREKLG